MVGNRIIKSRLENGHVRFGRHSRLINSLLGLLETRKDGHIIITRLQGHQHLVQFYLLRIISLKGLINHFLLPKQLNSGLFMSFTDFFYFGDEVIQFGLLELDLLLQLAYQYLHVLDSQFLFCKHRIELLTFLGHFKNFCSI